MRDTIIFDFDGTLIDSALGILATFSAVLNAAGIKPAVALDSRLIGPPLQPTMSKLAGPVEPTKLEALVEDFKLRYIDVGVARTPAYPAAEATLKQLTASGRTLYLATNKRAQPTLALLDKFGWSHYFRRIYCIDSHQPVFIDKTAMLRQLLNENQLSPERTLYVGDTRGDYLSASACGIKFIAAQWGYEDWQALPVGHEMLEQAYTSLSEMGHALMSQ
jgi:phosphoglycolate phosphatase